ncbi:hypothetical protein FN846DRAFT_167511 [Sphaerosporella brunnea]|uniref:Uncharacterized protein n=1 Tax=Sphaerosporella brunnea TaxID=1250544 RepID=A0A5J5EPX8_9PEZI|nr:hypothetical protein FN846DRAFT_167511 [Sphaerosporella brunnea]
MHDRAAAVRYFCCCRKYVRTRSKPPVVVLSVVCIDFLVTETECSTWITPVSEYLYQECQLGNVLDFRTDNALSLGNRQDCRVSAFEPSSWLVGAMRVSSRAVLCRLNLSVSERSDQFGGGRETRSPRKSPSECAGSLPITLPETCLRRLTAVTKSGEKGMSKRRQTPSPPSYFTQM